MAGYLFNLGIICDILHLSQSSVHSGGETRYFCLPLPSCCAPVVPADTSQTQRPFLFTCSRPSPAWSQQFVCVAAISLSIRPSALCVCVFYSALPQYKSTVAPGQSLGIGKKGRRGGQGWCVTDTLSSRIIQRTASVSVCVGGVASFLAVQVTALTTHVQYKALIETSTAVATVTVQLHSPGLMSSCQLQLGMKCAVIVLLLRAECK